MDDTQNNARALPNGSNCDVDLSNVPVKKIRLVYHVFQKDDGSENIQDDPAGRAFIGEIHNRLSRYRALDPMSLGYAGAYVADAKIEFEKIDVHFWQNTAMWDISEIFDSRIEDLHDFVIQQPIAHRFDAIHVMMPGYKPEPGGGAETFQGIACGFGCSDWTFLEDAFYWYNNGYEFDKMSNLLRHELGHNLDLYHSFQFNDRCDDTDRVANANGNNNNVMGYNPHQDALTTDQVSRIHKWLQLNDETMISGFQLGTMFADQTTPAFQSNSSTTHNVGASAATLEFTSTPDATDFTWTQTGGSGTFTTSNDGETLHLSNMGSVTMTLTWVENCLTFSRGYVFFNAPSYRVGPNPSISNVFVSVDRVDRVAFINDRGEAIERRNIISGLELRSSKNELLVSQNYSNTKNANIDISRYESGMFYLIIKNGKYASVRKIIKQ